MTNQLVFLFLFLMLWLIGTIIKLIKNDDILGVTKPMLSYVYDDGCPESIGGEERTCNPNDTGFPKVIIIVYRLFVFTVSHTPKLPEYQETPWLKKAQYQKFK